MNILFILSFRVSPNSGGVQRVTQTLAKEFISKENTVYYLSVSRGEEEIIEGVNQYYLPNGRLFNDLKNKKYFKELIDDKKIDIIINQIGFSLNAIKFIKDKLTNKIKVFTVHHNCVKCLNDQYHNIYLPTLKEKKIQWLFDNKLGWLVLKKIHKFRYSQVINKAIRVSDRVVLLSDSFIPEIEFYLSNFNRSKVVAIPNPNPFSDHSVSKNIKKNMLLYVGRLDKEQKRTDRIINIWNSLYKKFPDWQFHVLGDGSIRKELENKVRIEQIENIYFHGFKDPVPFYKEAKIICLTSNFEGYGMVLVEAQTYGVVPISTRSFSSIDNIIEDRVSGMIINDFDNDIYIKELHGLMNDKKKLNKMSINARNHINKFNSKEISNQWLNLFNEIV